jgi:lipopolysaccharide transport system ATP-binding protein
MSLPVIEVRGLSKVYSIGERRAAYGTLRDAIAHSVQRLRHVDRKPVGRDQIWALRDVSFDVHAGDAVGIIGRNGSGKSTLLKILSRIAVPTEGTAVLRGRVGSLLEVGTGFHLELTGRENIFLNGAILGMGGREIRRKFDEIIEFSGIERFIDTPVKYYSSGMHVRLAFSVAAHLEPEILVVDEVLAVGDISFQRKCIGKMSEVAGEGRTVLFVSHNHNVVRQLCSRLVYLDEGHLVIVTDDVAGGIHAYLAAQEGHSEDSEWRNDGTIRGSHFVPARIAIVTADGSPAKMPIPNDSDVWVEIEGEVLDADPLLTIGYALSTEDGQSLYWSYPTDVAEARWTPFRPGHLTLRSKLPKRLLNQGDYRVELIASLHMREWHLQPGVNAPTIELSIDGPLSQSPYWVLPRPGTLAPILEWEVLQ